MFFFSFSPVHAFPCLFVYLGEANTFDASPSLFSLLYVSLAFKPQPTSIFLESEPTGLGAMLSVNQYIKGQEGWVCRGRGHSAELVCSDCGEDSVLGLN